MDVNKKRILIISNEFPPNGGGRGIVAYQYCIELNKQGFDVTLLTSELKIKPTNFKEINVIEVKSLKKVWFLPYILKLYKINVEKFNTIILNDIASAYIAGIYFNKKLFNKSVHILHGDEPEQIYQNIDIFKRIFLLKYFYNRTIDNSKKIIAVSNYMKEKFLKETTFKDDKKIEVVYSGLSNDFFIEKKVNCQKIYTYQNKEIILSVSRLEKEKGFLDMYKIFKKLIQIDDSFIWIIIGDGSFKNDFEKIVTEDALNKKIIFKGKIPRNELYKYYKCSDIFWLLSKYKESFGLVYLEAQAYSCPAIGYNRYGVKEAIDNGKTGFLIDNEDDCLDIFLKKQYKEFQNNDLIGFASKFKNTLIDIVK